MSEQLALLGGKPVLSEPFKPYVSVGEEEKRAAMEVMDKKILSDFVGRAGQFFGGGEYVKKFEQAMTDYLGVKHAVSYNSATTALQGAVAALGIGPGDEVITSPFTMSATATSILLNNAIPVFADIDPDTYCISPDSIERNITERTKAIMVVNIFGGSADYDRILGIAKKHNLKVIEDNAQSIGAKYKDQFLGTVGDIGVFSFNVHKTLQCGEGGVLVTNSDEYALRAQLVRNHGEVVVDDFVDEQESRYEVIIGSNYRLSELHAAIGIEQLKKIDMLNAPRVELADYLSSCLEQFEWLEAPAVMPNTTHVYYVYPFKFKQEKIGISRDTFAKAMKAEGLVLNQGYVKPLYLMPMYQKKEMFPRSQFPFVSSEYPTEVSYEKGICPVVERMYEKEFMFTAICHYSRTKNDIDLFIKAIKKVEANVAALKAYEKQDT